jgi:hypothetical protein
MYTGPTENVLAYIYGKPLKRAQKPDLNDACLQNKPLQLVSPPVEVM